MPVTVKRFGGIIPMPREKTFKDEEIDAEARHALGTLLARPFDESVEQRRPDGFTYKFEVTGHEAADRSVAVSGADVPAALRKLLP